MTEISYFEGTSSYYVDAMLDHKIKEANLSLAAEENFKRKFIKFKEFFSRKNILKFGIMIGEEAIPIETTQGNIVISTIDKTQIEKRIETFYEKEKIGKLKFYENGNHLFTICYIFNYALSNTHHNIEFIGKNTIHIDEFFTPLVTLKSPIFRSLTRNSFFFIEAEKDLFEETEKPLFRNQNL
ncbi:viral movement protein [Medicago truncatula]|uniref:Viral movement protein n=1 Tax=Medicago truncatula TaxID=3880 RepID=G7JYB9_MEDTR|nr:viral movement protein [Medicago truncatula]